MFLQRGLLVAAVMVFGSLGFAAAASAANTITVNSTVDAPLTAAATTCTSTNGCTLRAGVQFAVQQGGAWTIILPAGTYKLTLPYSGPDDGRNGDLEVNGATITLQGAGSGSTIIDGNTQNRIFYINPGAGLIASGVTFQNGFSDTDNLETDSGYGGAIDTQGMLDLSHGDVVFSNNLADKNGGAVNATGSASALSTIYGDTFSGNTSSGESLCYDGGAIHNEASGALVIAYSVFTANDISYTGCDGGAIDHEGGALALDHVYFAHNGASNTSRGGALYFNGSGNLSVTNALFDSNGNTSCGACLNGGAIYEDAPGSTFTVSSSSFDNNMAENRGGAIFDNNSAAATFNLDKFSNNQVTDGDGGALLLDATDATTTTLTNDVFDHNSSTGDGGGVEWIHGILNVSASSFTNNSAPFGGGLFLDNDNNYPLTMVNTTFGLNHASTDGGAIWVQRDTPATLTNDTIAGNSSAGDDGGIALNDNGSSSFVLSTSNGTGSGVWNTIVASNGPSDCGDSTFNASFDSGFNLDSDATCFGGLGVPTDQPGVIPHLGPPAANGGPSAGFPGDTEVVATEAEQASSPSVDTGTNTGCPSTDARGAARDKDPCDKGAFELTAGSTTTTTTSTASTTQTSQTTVTNTITTHTGGGGGKPKKCKKGFHKSHGKCVKNKTHKKHKKHHKK
jgi:predicted outer membrane repeat protein